MSKPHSKKWGTGPTPAEKFKEHQDRMRAYVAPNSNKLTAFGHWAMNYYKHDDSGLVEPLSFEEEIDRLPNPELSQPAYTRFKKYAAWKDAYKGTHLYKSATKAGFAEFVQ